MDIDYLKKNHSRVYCFGLGFVQVVINPELRYHFYSPELITTKKEEIHNHRYDFFSKVLKGSLTNIKYRPSGLNVDKWYSVQTSCKEGEEKEVRRAEAMEEYTRSTYSAGDSYLMEYNEFHTIEVQPNTITELSIGFTVLDKATILSKSKEVVCPFSISHIDPWEVIENVINN